MVTLGINALIKIMSTRCGREREREREREIKHTTNINKSLGLSGTTKYRFKNLPFCVCKESKIRSEGDGFGHNVVAVVMVILCPTSRLLFIADLYVMF